jgi:hypothetical protein
MIRRTTISRSIVERAAVTALVAAGLPLLAGSRAHAAGRCDEVVQPLRAAIVKAMIAPRPSPGAAAAPESADRAAIAGAFQRGLASRPDCRTQILQLVGSLGPQPGSAGGRPASQLPSPSKAPFGPVGWLWLVIYRDVFRRSTLLMILFGWQLFLAPLTILFTTTAVIHGAISGIRKPVRMGGGYLAE